MGAAAGCLLPTPHSPLPIPTLFLVLATFTVGCGVQGPPRPPRVEQPAAVKDFAVIQRGKDLVLTFTVPALSTDGEQLTKPLEVEIYRAIEPSATSTPAFPPGGPPWRTLPERNLVSPSGPASVSVAIADDELAKSIHSAWTFYMRSLTRGFRRRRVVSDWSNPARHVLENVSVPVGAIEIKSTEKALVLHWTPPTESIAGGAPPEPSGYDVYRSLSGKAGTFTLLGKTAVANFSDPNFQFDSPYYYFVRALFKTDSQVAESDDSPTTGITPRDTFPPAAPSNLTAVFSGSSVELIWSPDTEADLAGYNVERRKEGSEFVKLNPKILPTPLYRDFSVEIGATYYYRVRALDRAGNVSAPSPEVEVEAR